jgi:hypothetical protein
MASKPASPITPGRTTGGRPTPPGSRSRVVPKLRQQRIDAIQAALDGREYSEFGSSSTTSGGHNTLPSAFPETVTKTPNTKPKPTSFKPVPIVAPATSQTSSSSSGPSVVKTEPLDPTFAPFLDTTESEEELWLNAHTPRVPYTGLDSSSRLAQPFPTPTTPAARPEPRGPSTPRTNTFSDNNAKPPSASQAQPSAVSESTPRTPPSAMKGRSQTHAVPSSSDDDFSVPSDDSFSPGSPDKRKRASRPTVEDVTDIDDMSSLPPKRHRGIPTPPTSSPVHSIADDDDDDAVPLVPGAFGFERERTRSVSPLAGREKGKARRRGADPTSPSKAGVRFALVCLTSAQAPVMLTHLASQQKTDKSTLTSLALRCCIKTLWEAARD